MGSSCWSQKMRGLILPVFAFMQVSHGAPQGSLNDLQSGFNRIVTTGEDENAPYTVIQKYDDFEERFYPGQIWVCTRNSGKRAGFWKLFGYISGDNNRNQKIDMTVPAMFTYNEKDEEMCFSMTSATQIDPPVPNNSDVYLSQKEDLTVFARSVSGYPDFGEEAEKLKNMLQIGLASQVDFSSYIVMNFNSPRKIINRRTDIMYKKL